MKQQGIPDEIKKFIADNIDSVAKLELLLLLVKNSSKAWTVTEINNQLRSNAVLISKYLQELTNQNLLSYDKTALTYRFVAQDKNRDKLMKALAQFYSTFQIRIIQLIYEKPVSSIQQFADAFKIRKDDGDDS